MSGIRSARQADEVDRLRVDRRRLVERLKQEVRYSPFLHKDFSQYGVAVGMVNVKLYIL